jgi:hypothetical protein
VLSFARVSKLANLFTPSTVRSHWSVIYNECRAELVVPPVAPWVDIADIGKVEYVMMVRRELEREKQKGTP